MDVLAEAATEYHPTTWPDVAFFAILALMIVGGIWAWRRKS